ncbi:helicase-associated domain-containing protein [Micromonospora sp. BRA006-A]|nr:helicase-associated domain-containing protein [Micromonospora sp. BRA006-A]
MHTYRLTPLGLWNARAQAGHDAEGVVDSLIKYSRYPVPHGLLVDVAETMDRYGRLQLANDPVHGLVLRALDRVALRSPRASSPACSAPGSTTTRSRCTRPSGAGSAGAAQAGLASGRPGRVRGRRGAPDRLAESGSDGGKPWTLGRTSGKRSRRSGPAGPAWWCCPAAPARPSSGRRRWPRRRRPR